MLHLVELSAASLWALENIAAFAKRELEQPEVARRLDRQDGEIHTDQPTQNFGARRLRQPKDTQRERTLGVTSLQGSEVLQQRRLRLTTLQTFRQRDALIGH